MKKEEALDLLKELIEMRIKMGKFAEQVYGEDNTCHCKCEEDEEDEEENCKEYIDKMMKHPLFQEYVKFKIWSFNNQGDLTFSKCKELWTKHHPESPIDWEYIEKTNIELGSILLNMAMFKYYFESEKK